MFTFLLNRHIIIEVSTVAKNEIGSPTPTFTELKRTWAGVSYTSGRTQSDTHGESARTDAVITIRYDSRVNYKCRIYYNNQYYRFEHIEVIGRNEGLRIRCLKWQDE